MLLPELLIFNSNFNYHWHIHYCIPTCNCSNNYFCWTWNANSFWKCSYIPSNTQWCVLKRFFLVAIWDFEINFWLGHLFMRDYCGTVMPELGGARGVTAPPQYLADQLRLFKLGCADNPHLLLLTPPMFFTCRHHYGDMSGHDVLQAGVAGTQPW